jgi:hypothetical protein
MIYVVEKFVAGVWVHARDTNGMPLMATSRRAAEKIIRDLDKSFTYRATHVRD